MSQRFPIATAQQLTEYVRALRKSRGQTQADVARLLGVSAMRVAAIEKDVGRLSTHSLIALLQLLGARLDLETDHEINSPSNRHAHSADDPTLISQSTRNMHTRSRGGEW